MAYEWFISYRRKSGGEKQAQQIAEILSKYVDKDKIFYDRESMYEGNWREQITSALKTASHFVVVLINKTYVSDNQSNNTDEFSDEIKTALKLNKKITLIECDKKSYDEVIAKHPLLKSVQKITFNGEYNLAFEERLCRHFGFNHKTASTIPTIINNVSIPEKLVPRRDMLEKLDNEFKSHQCVVISGIGGSGKTSLAYLYAKEQKFNNIAWVTVNGKVKDVFIDKIARLLFTKEDYEGFTRINDIQAKLDIIKSELSKIQGKNLLVFDININRDEIKQEIENRIYHYLPSGNWQTLVLTRMFVENPSRFVTIQMDTMTEAEAKELFVSYWQRTKMFFSDDQLAEITKELYYHPLLIEQTAIVFSKGHEKTADEIISKIKGNSKINNPRTNKILSGLAIEDKEQQDSYTYLINICKIDNLSDNEVKFLAVFVTWPEEPIDYEVIKTLLPNNEDTLYSLVEKGILSRNNKYQYSIHSLMSDVLRDQINVSKFDYTEYFANIQKLLLDEIKRVTLHKYSKCIASSFINYGICGNVKLFITFFYELCNFNDAILYNLPEPEFADVVKKLEGNAEPFQVAELFNAVAKVEEFKNNLIDAKSHYEKAFEIIEGVEENEETLLLNGALHQNLAMLEENLGDIDSAKIHYQWALKINRKLPETPWNIEKQATSLDKLANLEVRIGDTDSAKKHIEESLEIKRKLPEIPQYMDSLGIILNTLAVLEGTLGDTDSAKKHFYESLEINKKLPETPLYLYRLANTLGQLADLEETLGDTDSAIKHYEESLEINRRLPETPQILDSLANTLGQLANLEEKIGDTDSAKKHYEEGLTISRQSGNEEYMKSFIMRLLSI